MGIPVSRPDEENPAMAWPLAKVRFSWKLLLGAGLLALLLAWGGKTAWDHQRLHSWRGAVPDAVSRRNFALAFELLQKCLSLDPDNAELHFLAARVARRGEAYAAAVTHLNKARQLGWDPEAWQLEQALGRVQQGHMPAPLEKSLQRAVDTDHPEAILILEALVQGYLRQLRFGSCRSALERLLRRQPQHIQGLLWQARVSEHLQNLEAAAKSYHQVLQLDPEHDPTRLQLGELLLGIGRVDEAQEQFEKVVARQSGAGQALLGLARCRRLLGRTREALELLEQLPDTLLPRQQALVHLLRGRIALAEGHLDLAEKDLRQAQELAPCEREALFALIQCLQRQSKEEEAAELRRRWQQLEQDVKELVAVKRQIGDAPNDANLRFRAGQLCLQTGNSEEGLHWLDTALMLNPQHLEARKLRQQEDKSKK